MNIHKRTKLTPLRREEIYARHHNEHIKVSVLADLYHVSRPTVYKILARPTAQTSYRTGGKALEEQLKKEAKRYNKNYPGQMVHDDTKRLSLLIKC